MKSSLNYEPQSKIKNSFDFEEEGIDNIEKIIMENINKENEPFFHSESLFNQKIAEFNFYKTKKYPKLEVKEEIVLEVIEDIGKNIKDDERQIISFESGLEKNEKNGNDIIYSNNIYNSINRVVHKTLHGKKKLEENKCIFLDENKNFEVSQSYKNTEIDKKICSLKEKNKIFEFIAIKSLMISITNYMTELINYYSALFEKSIEENEKNRECKSTSEQEGDDPEEEIMKICNFNEIYSDFVSKSNICSSELEEYFKYSIDSFRTKYQIEFTLSELFTDIFWNSIFQNKIMCNLFVNSYRNRQIYGDMRTHLKRIVKIIYSANIPLKHQIVELLGLHQIEKYEIKDLMTLIVEMKKKRHKEIIKSEIEKENRKKNEITQSIKEKEKEKMKERDNEEININNINKTNNKEITNENTEKRMIYDGPVIVANNIGAIKRKQQNKNASAILSIDPKNNNNNNNSGVDNIINKNENKEKENNNININEDGVPDFTNKTVDEIINYINNDTIADKSTKGKKKKKSRKNKKAKKDESLAQQNRIEIEDKEILKFKEDINKELIYASSITKIKPVISEDWIKLISSYC